MSALEAERDMVTRELEELDDEKGGDDGPLVEAKTDKGKLTAKSVKDRLKAIKGDKTANEERHALDMCLALLEKEATATKRVKDAQKELDALVMARYAQLNENDLKALVVDDKWLATLTADVQTELNRVSQALSGRIRQLAERYAMPLPDLNAEVEALAAKVNTHLVEMGFAV